MKQWLQPDINQETQETKIEVVGWIRTQIPKKQAAADALLRPTNNRDRIVSYIVNLSDNSQQKYLLEQHNNTRESEEILTILVIKSEDRKKILCSIHYVL